MRDLLVTFLFVAVIPYVIKRPYIGACLMACIGFLNPHTQAWGFARSIPFVAIAVFFTLISMVANRGELKFKINSTFVFIYVFLVWGSLCTLNAFFPDKAMIELSRFTKIQITIFLSILVITRSYQLRALVWTTALSLAYFGVKGALFTIQTGGGNRVYGPPRTFIGGNNEIGLALLMTIPLLVFCAMHTDKKWVKRGLWGIILCCLLSIVFTYSRGAFLGLVAMLLFLWWKSDHKVQLGLAGLVLIFAALPFIPSTVFDRLSTIETYQEDQSALGRINAWTLAFNMANDRVTGGGYQHVSPLTTQLYAPNPHHMADAHSIYFEVLGEMGWIGFMLFFLIHFTNWLAANRIIKLYKGDADRKWAVDLAKMIQVSLIAYYSGGAFLGLAYWDMPYYLMVMILLLTKILPAEQEAEEEARKKAELESQAQEQESETEPPEPEPAPVANPVMPEPAYAAPGSTPAMGKGLGQAETLDNKPGKGLGSTDAAENKPVGKGL